jgi:hypothetical protein
MEYAIEFIRRMDDKVKEMSLGFAILVADGGAGIIAEAEAQYRNFNTVPRPDGFRVRDRAGNIIHEFYEREHA